jgi:hypothetical protein
MMGTFNGGRQVSGPAGHWERVAEEVWGLALLRGVGVPPGVLEWLDLRELLALRSALLESTAGPALRRRFTLKGAGAGVLLCSQR